MPHYHYNSKKNGSNAVPRFKNDSQNFKYSRNKHQPNRYNGHMREMQIKAQPIVSIQVVDDEQRPEAKKSVLARVFGGTALKRSVEVVDLEKEEPTVLPSDVIYLDEQPGTSNQSRETVEEVEGKDEYLDDTDDNESVQFLYEESTSTAILENVKDQSDCRETSQGTFPEKNKKRKRKRNSKGLRSEMENTTSAENLAMECPNTMDGLSVYMNQTFPNKNQHRRWKRENPSPWAPIMNGRQSVEFVICSYNVLCQETIASTQYLYNHTTHNDWLQWENRWAIFEYELPKLGADIFGMQEVQDDHFANFFQPFMASGGYHGIYKKKTGMLRDGCAIFYKIAMFDLIEYVDVNYYVNEEATSNRNNIGQIVVLRSKLTNGLLIVANTHLIFNEERGDVKLAQLIILFANIDEVREKYSSSKMKPSLIILGDFNMEPLSAIYTFITQSFLMAADQNVRNLSGQSVRSGGKLLDWKILIDPTSRIGMDCRFDKSSTLPRDGCLYHPFLLKSTHSHGKFGKRDISTYHKQKANPDFIFYSVDSVLKDQLVLTHNYQLPQCDMLNSAMPWPNNCVPSDHIPLLAKFRLTT